MVDSEQAADRLLQRVLAGDEQALAQLFLSHRDRLKRMVSLRLDRRLQGRVDASDVLQEAYLELARQMPAYARKPDLPLFLWLRLVTGQRLLQIHRRHLGASKRDAGMEVSLYRKPSPQASTQFLASRLIGQLTSASEGVIRGELQVKLQETLNLMDEMDREILALRHFEELSNEEAARVLGIQPATASKRHLRALRRLKAAMANVPEMQEL